MAMIQALESIKPAGQRIEIYSDSAYVVRGVNKWLPAGVQNGWVSSSGKPVANRDLWEKVCQLLARHRMRVTWVPRAENISHGAMAS